MPSIYTIEGSRRGRRGRKSRRGRGSQQRKFSAAAKRCSRESKRGKSFKACMRRELKK